MKEKHKGTLYLVPSTIGNNQIHTIPQYVLERVLDIRIFIVENLKTARRYLRVVGYIHDFEKCIFHTLDKHTPFMDTQTYLNDISQGSDIALLSESGCPCIADPGASIVRQAHKKGIRVVPLVGPSSILMALISSGMNGQKFAFHGYLPIEKNQRNKKIKELERNSMVGNQSQIFMEAPHRNSRLFVQLLNTCQDKTELCIAVDISLDTEDIQTKTIKEWKGVPSIDIHKRLVVFVLYNRKNQETKYLK